MKNILTTFSFVLFILYSATGYAQRFPNLSFKSMSEIEGKDIFFMDTVHSVEKYRIALYKYYDLERRWPTSKRFAIVRDWIEDNRYIQVIPYKGSVDYVQSELFKFTGGAFLSPDKEPFMYSDIKVYCDREKWSNFNGSIENWSSYGYAACKQCNGWKPVKVTQFPMLIYEVVGEGFSSAEEAMKSIGINDSERYITEEI